MSQQGDANDPVDPDDQSDPSVVNDNNAPPQDDPEIEFQRASPQQRAAAVAQAQLILRLAGATVAAGVGGLGNMPTGTAASVIGTAANLNVGGATGGAGGGNIGQQAQQGGNNTQPQSSAGTSSAAQAQASLFPKSSDASDDDIAKASFFLSKDKREGEGTKVGLLQKSEATKGLSVKFDILRHQSSYSGGGESSRSATQSIQKQLTTILQLTVMGMKQCQKWDMLGICNVSALQPNAGGNDPTAWWDHSIIWCLWVNWEAIDERTAKLWQYTINKRGGNADLQSSRWLLDFLEASSTPELRALIDKKYTKLPVNQQGGVVYLWMLLTSMFVMSREVREACREAIKVWGQKGVTVYPGENFFVAQEEIIGIATRLNTVNELDDTLTVEVFRGCTKTSHTGLRDQMKTLFVSAELGSFHLLGAGMDFATNLEKCEAIFAKATDVYDTQCKLKKWNVPKKGGGQGGIAAACFNCGKDGCYVDKCDQPKDEERIKRERKKYMDEKRKKGNNPKSGGGKPSGGDKKQSGNYQRSQFGSAVVGANGIVMVAGVPHLSCKICGELTTTHGTKTHPEWAKNPDAFCLPSNHPLALAHLAKGTANAATGQSTGTAAAPASTDAAGGSPGISRSQVEQNLTALERNSTDPNAAAMASMLRELFLNR